MMIANSAGQRQRRRRRSSSALTSRELKTANNNREVMSSKLNNNKTSDEIQGNVSQTAKHLQRPSTSHANYDQSVARCSDNNASGFVSKLAELPQQTQIQLAEANASGARMERRRAVTATDHKMCVLLHSRLKGIKLDESRELGGGRGRGQRGAGNGTSITDINETTANGTATTAATADSPQTTAIATTTPTTTDATTTARTSKHLLASGSKVLAMIEGRLDANAKAPASLFIFEDNNYLRRKVRSIIESSIFEYLVLATIIANCISLTLEEHLPFGDKTPLSAAIERSETYFLFAFTLEALLKIFALGFALHSGAYLRNVWNLLDFVVVLTGLLAFALVNDDRDSFSLSSSSSQINYSQTSSNVGIDLRTLRAMRVLRPLKLVGGVSSLQVVLKSIVKAMAPLLQIALLVLFAIVVFAIIGLEFYSGVLHFACYHKYDTSSLVQQQFTQQVQPCFPKLPSDISTPFGANICNETSAVCLDTWIGPNHGITSFDNIFFAMLTVFQCITTEGWTSILYWTNDALGSAFNWLYFVPLIIVGSFFMLNLVLGVLSGEFARERERVENRRAFLKMRREQQIETELSGYVAWICKAEQVVHRERKLFCQNGKSTKQKQTKTNNNQNQFLGSSNSLQSIDSSNLMMNQNITTSIHSTNNNNNIQHKISATPTSLANTKLFVALRHAHKELKTGARLAINSQAFHWSVIVMIFLNTFCAALEHHNQPNWLTMFLDKTEQVFLTLFLLELCIKLYAMGLRAYFASPFNKFDALVVAISALATALELFSETGRPPLGLSSLRALRLLRIFKLTKHWAALRNLVTSLLASMRSILSLLFLLFLFLLIFALLGMQLFGGAFNFESGTPAANFDSISSAMLAVFQILTGEDWNEVMYNAINSQGGATNGGMIYSIYFVILVLLGNYTLLNVFLAIAVDNLANAQEMTAAQQMEASEERERCKAAIETQVASLRLDNNRDIETNNNNNSNPLMPANQVSVQIKVSPPTQSSILDNSLQQCFSLKQQNEKVPTHTQAIVVGEFSQHQKVNSCDDTNQVTKQQVHEQQQQQSDILPYSSLFFFSSQNKFRIAVHKIVTFKYFEPFIMTVIIISSATLAAEDPLVEDSEWNEWLNVADHLFTFVFTAELVLKLIDVGAFLHPNSYCRDAWNCLDALVVICALIAFAFSSASASAGTRNLSTVKAFRVLRVLRPLKTIKRVPKLKAVFDCVLTSLRNVFNILVVYMLFQFIFAVIAVQLFKGRFFYCSNEVKLTREECKGDAIRVDSSSSPITGTTTTTTTTFTTTTTTTMNFNQVPQQYQVSVYKRQWLRHNFNYDDVFSAMLTLFTVQTSEGWPSVLQHSMDSTFEDFGPLPFYRMEMSLFYIIFFIVFPFFFVNIFVALIIITFQEQGEKELEEGEIDKNQRSCIDFAIHAKPKQLFMPTNKWSFQHKIWKLVVSQHFEYLIMALIVGNTLLLMMKSASESETQKTNLRYLNHAFTCLFALECLLKILAFNIGNFFSDRWNTFDFVTVVGSLIDALIVEFGGKKNHMQMGFLRLFRAARLVKLLRQGYTIRILLWTFIQSFKALPYVCLLIAMLFFIYAIIGMQVFGNIAFAPDSQITKHNNFRTFVQGLMLLFRCATGEGWPQVMISCVEGQQCDTRASRKGRSCGSNVAYSYFVSFVFLCSFLMLNLFVAVIMDNFDYLTRDPSILGAHHLDEFIQVWAEYDPRATGKIKHSEMYDMLRNMDPPLGFGNKCPSQLAYKKLIRMNMPIDNEGKVQFTTTLFALIRENLSIKMRPAHEMDTADQELRITLRKLWPLHANKLLNKLVPPNNQLNLNKLTVGKIYVCELILENWKSCRFRAASSSQPALVRLMGAVQSQLQANSNAASTSSVEMSASNTNTNNNNTVSANKPESVQLVLPAADRLVDVVSEAMDFVRNEGSFRRNKKRPSVARRRSFRQQLAHSASGSNTTNVKSALVMQATDSELESANACHQQMAGMSSSRHRQDNLNLQYSGSLLPTVILNSDASTYHTSHQVASNLYQSHEIDFNQQISRRRRRLPQVRQFQSINQQNINSRNENPNNNQDRNVNNIDDNHCFVANRWQ